jgi:hypothetical protein
MNIKNHYDNKCAIRFNKFNFSNFYSNENEEESGEFYEMEREENNPKRNTKTFYKPETSKSNLNSEEYFKEFLATDEESLKFPLDKEIFEFLKSIK